MRKDLKGLSTITEIAEEPLDYLTAFRGERIARNGHNT